MPTTDNTPDTRSRELLAAIYGEGEALGPREASEFEATRDLLSDFVNEPADPAVRQRLREAIEGELRAAPATTPKASPMREVLWVRSQGGTALIPSDRPIALAPGSHLIVPRGGRALVTFPDGTEMLLAGESRMALSEAPEKDVVATLESGRLYAWVSPRPHRVFALSTPHGDVRVHGTEFDVNLQHPDQLDLTVASGSVEFAPVRDGAKPLLLARRDALVATGSGELTEHLSTRELRRRVEWSREERRPGRVILGLAAGTVLLGAAIFLAARSRPEAVTDTAIQAAPLQDEGNVTGSPQAWAAAMIGADIAENSHLTVLVEGQKGGRWIPESRIVMTEQLGNLRPDGSRDFQVVHDEVVRLNEDGSVIPMSAGAESRTIKGLTITGRISPDGTPQDVRIAGRQVASGREALHLLNFHLYNPLFLLPASPPAEGTTWQRPASGSIAQLPGAVVSVQRTIRREPGIEEQGRRLDRYTMAMQGTYGNIEADNRVVSQVRNVATIRESAIRSRGELFTEAGTRRMVRCVIHREEIMQLTRTLTAPGKEPVESTLPRVSEVSRLTITYEKLPGGIEP